MINDVRRDETANFNKAAVTFNDAVNAIDDCVDIAANFETGSFIEIARMSGKLVKHAVKLGKSVAYKSVMGALA